MIVKGLLKKKKLKVSEVIILGSCLYNIGLIHDSREEYKKAIYYYVFSARLFNYKAIINLLFHFEKAGRVIMFTIYLKKLINIYTKYKKFMEPKYVEKCKNIIKKDINIYFNLYFLLININYLKNNNIILYNNDFT